MNSLTNAPKPTFGVRFRRAFVTGLLVLAPVWLTGYILMVVVRLLGGMLSPYVRLALEKLFDLDPESTLVVFASDLSAFVATVLLIAAIGVVVNRVLGKRLLGLFDYILSRIPVVRELYDAIRKFIQVFFGDKSSFRGVVAVKYPTEASRVIGFVTAESNLIPGQGKLLHVFVPLAPAPTQGLLFFVPEAETLPLDLSVDEAIKLIVSGGAIPPERYAV
ncbi:MAG: DUF502 domain-containing protein [bacterium]|nr:DUF502 domain-containing protein [bacterium]